MSDHLYSEPMEHRFTTADALAQQALAISRGGTLQLDEEEAQALMAAANTILLLLRRAMRPQLAAGNNAERMMASSLKPMMPINETVTREYIVCLEDGARVKSLKSYLRRFGLTPDQYRQRWGLPQNYPMAAPALSEKRSAIARQTKPHLKRKPQNVL